MDRIKLFVPAAKPAFGSYWSGSEDEYYHSSDEEEDEGCGAGGRALGGLLYWSGLGPNEDDQRTRARPAARRKTVKKPMFKKPPVPKAPKFARDLLAALSGTKSGASGNFAAGGQLAGGSVPGLNVAGVQDLVLVPVCRLLPGPCCGPLNSCMGPAAPPCACCACCAQLACVEAYAHGYSNHASGP